jgi:hypothetical protein
MFHYSKNFLVLVILFLIASCKEDQTGFLTLNRDFSIPFFDTTRIDSTPVLFNIDSAFKLDSVTFRSINQVLTVGKFYVSFDTSFLGRIQFDSLIGIGCFNPTRNATSWITSTQPWQNFYNFENSYVANTGTKNQEYQFFCSTSKRSRILGSSFIVTFP